jgi:hypothetical protein
VPIWAKKSAGMAAIGRPNRSFSCDSAISTAMPWVKPITMATGMWRTSAPSLNSPSANSSTPASAVEISRLVRP